ncbi:MAG: hypothetical protein ACREP9_09765, partial [Candidatus Dormibacteraceae bacterium]
MRRLLNMHRLPTGPTKIALITTAILAIGYLVIGTVVVIAVVYQLTQEVDHRLDRRLLNLQSNATPESGSLPTPHGGHWREPPTRGFNAPTLIWGFSSDGDSYRSESAPELPSIYHHITNPQTVSLSGEEFRIRGGPLNGGWVVVGRASPNIGSTRDTVILTELAMCPLFLGAVFIGAWLIGSYVAKPIEQNHRRQLEFTADASHELRT